MILIEKVLLLKKSQIFENCSETDLLEIAAVCEEIEEEKNITVEIGLELIASALGKRIY